MGPSWFWLQTMRIGDYLLANMPGEMTVQMARRVRYHILQCPIDCDASGNQIVHHALLVGLANDYMSYTTTPEEYDYQWYEGTFTLWGQQEGPLLRDRFGKLVDAMLHGNQVSFVEPPDTSGTQADNVSPVTQALSNVPLTAPPGTPLLKPASSVKRGHVANFTWVGGQPSAEVVQDQAFITTECQVAGKWRATFSDGSGDALTDYLRKGVEDHWGTRWDVPLDAPAGSYRFTVKGQAYVGGQIQPYSTPGKAAIFNVQPDDELTVTSSAPNGSTTLVGAAYPKPTPPKASPGPIYGPNDLVDTLARLAERHELPPDPNMNFRLRPAGPTSGSITITVTHQDGTTATGTGTYDAARRAYVVSISSQVGDTVSVAPRGLIDAYGNNNGALSTVKVAGALTPLADTGITLPQAAGLPTPAIELACAGNAPAPVVGQTSSSGTSSGASAPVASAPASASSSATSLAGRQVSASSRVWPWLVAMVLMLGLGTYIGARLRRRWRRGLR
jgi:hypothetical protein